MGTTMRAAVLTAPGGTFVLADGMKVEGALLAHGLLHIDLIRPEPERLVQRIPIKTAG